MTCQLTTTDHTDYGLPRSFTSNKRSLTLYNDLKKPIKITKGPKWPCAYQRQGATRAPTCTHTHKLHSASLKCNGLYIIHYWTILKQWTKYLKDYESRQSEINHNHDHSGRPVFRNDTMLCFHLVSPWIARSSIPTLAHIPNMYRYHNKLHANFQANLFTQRHLHRAKCEGRCVYLLLFTIQQVLGPKTSGI
jgi:hypothetical protein